MIHQHNIVSGFILVLLLIILMQTTSCKKFLDEVPDSKLTVPKTLSDLQALLDFSNNMNIRQSPSFGEGSSDNYFLLDATYNAIPVENQKIYTWNRGDYRFQNDWSKAYLPVYNANYCLEQLENIPVTPSIEKDWNTVKGCALFFRAHNFLNLLWVYAKSYDETSSATDHGIVLRMGSDFNVPSQRASVKECYDRVIADAKQSVANLEDLPVHVMRPSKAAAYGLLARAYLSMRKYDSAYRYADLCLQIKSSLMDFNGDADINGSIGASTPFKKFNKEIIFYNEMNTNFFIHSPTNAKVDSSLYGQYALNDLRKTGYYRLNAGYYQFKGSYTATSSQYFTGIACDEMYLIRAECHARLDRTAEAMNDLNTLMQKRWRNTVPYPTITASTAQEAVSKVLTERRKELYMRGLRWMDIKRLNKEGHNIILTRKIAGQLFTLQPNAGYYALPIPIDIIQQTGIPQN